jgi:hypothetical protein
LLNGNAGILQPVKVRGTKLLTGYWLHAVVRTIFFHFIEILRILWFSFRGALRPDSGSWPPLRGFAITLRHTTLGSPLWTSGQPHADTSTWQDTALTRDRQTSMPPAGFELTFPVSEWPQTHFLDFAATGIGNFMI